MSDILEGARELRQKLYYLEVLLEIQKGERRRSWFSGKGADAVARAAAIKRLVQKGLVEAAEPPDPYKLTASGHEFVQDLRAKVGSGRALDWTHADEIDFSRL